MGMLESVVRWRFTGMGVDERVAIMERLMPILFENISSKDLRNMAELLLPALIEQFIEALEAPDLTKMASKVVPQMVGQTVSTIESEEVHLLLTALFPELVRIFGEHLDEEHLVDAICTCRESLDRLEERADEPEGDLWADPYAGV